MLSRILLLSIEKNNTDLLGVVARAVREMSEGELLQIEKARKLDITEEIYFEVIRKKTASLISTCCEAGAISVEANEHRNRMKEFGEMVGMAFQIKDDIFDYGSPGNIGKPTGIDIREQKMTLPLIYTLNHSDKASRAELMNIIKNKHEDSKQIARAIELVIQNGGIEYAFQKMNNFATKAIDLLEPLPESHAKKSLIGLVHYTINRDK
jgi:octaprenyl-diphosphate synthase